MLVFEIEKTKESLNKKVRKIKQKYKHWENKDNYYFLGHMKFEMADDK